jgi:ABC-type nickel/cobalt efflux system permease component RcnA
MPTTVSGLLAVSFVLGFRHALDVDHLAAVSTIVSRRRSLWSSSMVGALWGIGHTVSLATVAIVVIALHQEIPPAVDRALELGVAAMLILLGLNLIRRLVSGRMHLHAHAHRGHVHIHPHVHGGATDPEHHHGTFSRRPVLVGLMHGLAGSAGLMLSVVVAIPDPRQALAYVAVFACGTIGGMMLMSTLLGAPFTLVARRFAGVERALGAVAAVCSVAVGLTMVWTS